MADAASDSHGAEARLREARALFEDAGLTHDAARATAHLSLSLWRLGRGEEALELLEPALEVLRRDEPDEDIASLAAEAGRIHYFLGDNKTGLERIEVALEIAEQQGYPVVLSDALNTKALLIFERRNESRALLREALAIALEHDLIRQALRAYNNLSSGAVVDDRWDDARRWTEAGLELARSRGEHSFTNTLGMGLISELIADGDWDGAFALADELTLEPQTAVASQVTGCLELARIAYARDDPALAERWLARISPEVEATNDIQLRNVSPWRVALVAMGEGRPADALSPTLEVVERAADQGSISYAEVCFTDVATIATDLGDPALATPFLAVVEARPARERTRPLEIACARIRANAAAAAGEQDVAADEYARGLGIGRNLGRAGLLAPLLLDYGRWLVQTGRSEEAAPLLDEARESFEVMRATRWLERLEQVTGAQEAEVAVT